FALNCFIYNILYLRIMKKGMFDFSEVATYFFRKKDPNRKTNFNLRTMHVINKISMLMFLAGIIYFVITHI
ncbi:DUF6728 family protein, partial [Pontibacter rugosus]